VTLRGWITFVTLCIFWGIPYFFIKLALHDLSPAFVAWSRVTLGAAALLPVAWHRGVLGTVLKHKVAVIVFAVSELVIPFWMIPMGERWISSSLAGILVATCPLVIVIIAPLFGVREVMNARRWLGFTVGFVGVIVLLGLDTNVHGGQWLGIACLIAAIIGYAVGPLVVQKYLRGVDELGSLAASLVVASLVLLPAAMLSRPVDMPSALSIASIVVLGLICTAIALLLYFYLIHEAGAARSSVVAYVSPAIAAILGVAVLHEQMGVGTVIGLALILLGSWLSTGRVQHKIDE